MESYRVSQSESSGNSNEEEANNTFGELKSLIIKSADIVDAYYKAFDVRMSAEGKYMAVSDFGTFYENSSAELVGKYDSIEQKYTNLQEVVDVLGETVGKLSSEGSIVSGMLGYDEGIPVYGIKIGRKVNDEVTGEEIFNEFARFTSSGLELFANPNSTAPTAIFKHSGMYINNAEVSGTLKLGGYKIETSKGLAFTWVGR
jgi:hypothetical protein